MKQSDAVRAWLDTWPVPSNLADNPDAMAKEFGVILGVFERDGSSPAKVGRVFELLKLTNPQQRVWPTAGQVMQSMQGVDKPTAAEAVMRDRGDRSRLTSDQKHKLTTEVLPTARRWLDIDGLRHHGKSTLEFWGDTP